MTKQEANARFNEIKSAGLYEYTGENVYYGRCVYPKSFELIGGGFSGNDYELRILFSDGLHHREEDMADFGLIPAGSSISLDGSVNRNKKVVDIFKDEESFLNGLDLISEQEELERHNRIQRAKMGIIDEPINHQQQTMHTNSIPQQQVQNNPVHLILDNIQNLEKTQVPIDVDIQIISKDVYGLLKTTFPDRALTDVVSYFLNKIDTNSIKVAVDKSLRKFITEKLGEVYVEPVEEVEEVEINLFDDTAEYGLSTTVYDDDADVMIDGVAYKNNETEKKN